MRTLVLMAALLWGAASWWWYTCDIKGYCDVDTVQAEGDKEKSVEDVAVTEKIKDADDSDKPKSVVADIASNSNKEEESSSAESPAEVKTDEKETEDTDAGSKKAEVDVPDSNETKADADTTVTEPPVKEDETTEAKTAENDTVEPSTSEQADATDETNDATKKGDAESDVATESSKDTTEAVAPVAAVEEEIVSPDDNDPKKIRIDKVADSVTANIQKARIYFPFSSSKKADLTGSATRYFDKVVAALKADENLKIQLTGHTDSQGQAKRNQTLGLRRAETVKKIFIEKGVKASQITTDSKGENSPIATNKSEAGRNKNRRVTVEAISTTTESE